MENCAAASDPLEYAVNEGGNRKWKSGSALPQKSIPTATVVQSTIENQLIRLNFGLAFLPPIRTPPKGEKTTKMQVRTMAKEL
ncbi:hypothetical protein GCM10011339_01590 [Echinicola rosea]|uniref:Uncharacterized protein n=1 Tax=Echinicola rosea TaxID=1807691 RepID=A0ABQ1UF46_9BACT|nr:hypothetical protein GCM10011339_01590 [Echinicola rosea]